VQPLHCHRAPGSSTAHFALRAGIARPLSYLRMIHAHPFTGSLLLSGRKASTNLADTERNERQAFNRQQFSAAKSEMAYHNHFVLNSLGGNPKSAMPFPFSLCYRDLLPKTADFVAHLVTIGNPAKPELS
jgi:hypothetical protein